MRTLALNTATGFACRTPVDAARSVENLARTCFIMVDEPEELLVDPSIQMDELEKFGAIRADCDDCAMFVASLLYLIGLQVRFKAVILARDGSYQHVFTEYRQRESNRWIPVDPTIRGIPIYPPGEWIVEVV